MNLHVKVLNLVFESSGVNEADVTQNFGAHLGYFRVSWVAHLEYLPLSPHENTVVEKGVRKPKVHHICCLLCFKPSSQIEKGCPHGNWNPLFCKHYLLHVSLSLSFISIKYFVI
jgi:hypothetical protein